jgi:hypothetical protein
MSGCGFAGDGNYGDRMIRPARQCPPGTIRPPDLTASLGPVNIGNIVGFGVGSGATITQRHGIADNARGTIAIRVGVGPLGVGTVNLQFFSPPPAAAGGLWLAASWATLNSVGTNPVVITCIATETLIPGTVLLLTYEWQVMR